MKITGQVKKKYTIVEETKSEQTKSHNSTDLVLFLMNAAL
jgi:hypothetical protein